MTSSSLNFFVQWSNCWGCGHLINVYILYQKTNINVITVCNLNKLKKLVSFKKSVTSSYLDHLHECLDDLVLWGVVISISPIEKILKHASYIYIYI